MAVRAEVVVEAAAGEGVVGVVRNAVQDKFGIGWRPELAAGIFSHLDVIDVVEVIADDYYNALTKKLGELSTLASQVPIVLHGINMGLCSAEGIPDDLVRGMAQLYEKLAPEFWSEHLSFVRAGGVEIGHLAAPPWNEECVEITVRNLERVRSLVGVLPHVENVSTFLRPPFSTLSEAEWLAAILHCSPVQLLFDLHNVIVNNVNVGSCTEEYLQVIPCSRISALHIAGGLSVSTDNSASVPRILDDHRHATPPEVFALLKEIAARSPQQLVVILERDGDYPPFEVLLAELAAARAAVASGRREQSALLAHE